MVQNLGNEAKKTAMTTYEDLLASLPAERRARIKARAKKLIGEEKVRRSTVPRRPVARRGSDRPSVGIGARLSRLEARGDMSINALRRQVAPMRGKLRVLVGIEGRPPRVEASWVGRSGAGIAGRLGEKVEPRPQAALERWPVTSLINLGDG
jgi:hypothetical protein